MTSELTVTTAAASTALTTLDTVKSDLGVTSSDEDDYLGRLIAQVSEQVCARLRLPSADDGTCSLGRESLTQTYHLRSEHSGGLSLARWLPRSWVMSIDGVTEAGVDLVEDDDFRLDPKTGILRRRSGGRDICWRCGVDIAAAYTAGWLLPNDTGRDLPVSIENAAIGWIKFCRLNKTRDAALRSESILSGLYSYQLFSPSDTPDACPADVASTLDPYARSPQMCF